MMIMMRCLLAQRLDIKCSALHQRQLQAKNGIHASSKLYHSLSSFFPSLTPPDLHSQIASLSHPLSFPYNSPASLQYLAPPAPELPTSLAQQTTVASTIPVMTFSTAPKTDHPTLAAAKPITYAYRLPLYPGSTWTSRAVETQAPNPIAMVRMYLKAWRSSFAVRH